MARVRQKRESRYHEFVEDIWKVQAPLFPEVRQLVEEPGRVFRLQQTWRREIHLHRFQNLNRAKQPGF